MPMTNTSESMQWGNKSPAAARLELVHQFAHHSEVDDGQVPGNQKSSRGDEINTQDDRDKESRGLGRGGTARTEGW